MPPSGSRDSPTRRNYAVCGGDRVRHPHRAITAAIIGPRKTEHLESQLTAAHVTLSDDVPGRLDETNP
jgi:hypothetical protein